MVIRRKTCYNIVIAPERNDMIAERTDQSDLPCADDRFGLYIKESGLFQKG